MDITNEAMLPHMAFSPAERAVIVEQAETLKVNADEMIAACKDDTTEAVLKKWNGLTGPMEYMNDLFRNKAERALMKVLSEED